MKIQWKKLAAKLVVWLKPRIEYEIQQEIQKRINRHTTEMQKPTDPPR